MITSQKTEGQSRRELSKWTLLKNRITKMANDLSLESDDLTKLCDSRIEELSRDLHEYDSARQSIRFDSVDVLHAATAIPSKLVKARILLGWSTTELAKRVDIAPQAISRYERYGYKSISLSKAIQIAKALAKGFEGRT